MIDELSIGFDTAEFEMRESADGEKIRLITRLRPEETRILSQYENQLETALGRWARDSCLRLSTKGSHKRRYYRSRFPVINLQVISKDAPSSPK